MTTNTVRVPLRWRDLDSNGHVYHGTFLTLLDEARSRWLRDGLALEGADSHVIARIEIDYAAELTAAAEYVDVDCQIERLGTKSVTTQESMRSADGTEVSRSKAVVVFWDQASRMSSPPSPADRARLEQATAVR